MKILITYKSKYGSSKQYALWLSEELKCEVKDLKEITKKNLAEYDLVIHGGGIYAGNIAGLNFYKKNLKYMEENNKKLIVFATGASKAGKKTNYTILKQNFTGNMKDITFFYCEGNYDYSIMSGIHKFMMKMMNKMLTKQIKKAEEKGKKADPEAIEFQSMLFSHFERVNKKWTEQITDFVKSM